MEKDNIKGCFVSSVLLSQNQWDKKQFIHDFEEDWGIVLTDDDDNGDVLVGMFSGMTLAIARTQRRSGTLCTGQLPVERCNRSGTTTRGSYPRIRDRRPIQPAGESQTVHQSHVFLPETVLRYSGIYRRYGVPTRILQGYGRTPARR